MATEPETVDDETISDEVLDAVADAVSDDLENPSRIARRAKVTTYEAHRALDWLEGHRFIVGEGNGAWRRFRTRRFGESA